MRSTKKIYLAGPMRGIPYFNFPAFSSAAADLRSQGYIVFSPAEKDEADYGKDFSTKYKTGSQEDANADGFSLRDALAGDLAFICLEADGVCLLSGWENSKGALAERATALALGLEVWQYERS